MRHQHGSRPHPQIGLGWYTREQWQRLVALAPDRADLDDTFEEWREQAERALEELTAQGHAIRKVFVDVDDLAAWCESRGRPRDASARAEYITEQTQRAAGEP